MKRLTFLVNQGENDCYMIHGLDWATYAEGRDWEELTESIRTRIQNDFTAESRPEFLDFRFPDGSVISLVA
ncbi:MAG: hypothetical protein LIQ31_14280 [Planctomycetes bacterium]|nr:hypothetical protein [Planctomycetota bacterium]